ncbi:hypothetical protein CNMCM6106_007633 [Aspergillus hiratsukae]|uniref:Uncharacterized protein n=1 Tax=Aspergillus hiratsukae TaxID=1194566 RepID=A0A8H6V0I8_9EURO|nr:hypothetical protein CNMCM6106_007633 [Aspergillus hiratsukae]
MDKFNAGDANARSQAQDVLGRNNFTNTLVNDTTGKLALMTGGDPTNPVDFGEEIREKAKAINRNQLQALLPGTLAQASSTSNIARPSAAPATPESIHCRQRARFHLILAWPARLVQMLFVIVKRSPS